MNIDNIFLNADSYKASHFNMYPPGTTKVYSYVESRGGDIDNTVFFGLQFFLNKLKKMFPTMDDVEEAREFYEAHGEPFNYEGAKQLVELGYFPLEIKAVKEGTVMPTRNILVSITNTHSDFGWLVSFLETLLLLHTWYPTTVASYSKACKDILQDAYNTAVDDDKHGGLLFALHDFGFRGVSSIDTAGIGGLAHLVNFRGSDTVIANAFANRYYGHKGVASYSVPACFDDQTEILTNSGFKLFSQLSDNDLVAQYNSDGSIEFVIPDKKHEYDYSGDMVQFSTKGQAAKVNLLVTPNHKMVSRNSRDEISLTDASDMNFNNSVKLPQSGYVSGEQKALSWEDKLRIAFQADGSFVSSNRISKYDGSRSGTKPIRFSLKKDRKKKNLVEILEKVGIDYTVCDGKGVKNGYTSYWCPTVLDFSKNLRDWIDLENISSTWIDEFVDEISKWDGTNARNSVVYSSTVEDNAIMVQTVGILGGYRASFRKYVDKRPNRKPLYIVTLTKLDNRGGQGIYKDTVQYTGKVYCVSVPSKMILVRRNGIVSVCGNCEHSTINAWGRYSEVEAYTNILDKYPTGVVSVVSDSYNVFHAVSVIFGKILKDRILSRDGVFVVRPDSGDPEDVLFGTGKEFQDEQGKLESMGILEILWERFGGYVNKKGYRVLNDKVRVLQGDGINRESLQSIVDRLIENNWSPEIMVFGMGGKLLQSHNRDTMKFACKCSYVQVNGEDRDVFKDPITDVGKKSKKGILSLVKRNGKFKTVSGSVEDDLLEIVFRDSEVTRTQVLDEIRDIAE